MSNFTLSSWMGLAFAVVVSPSLSRAELSSSVDYGPYKVLGRGVSDKDTGEALQMACVGESTFEAGEMNCTNIQFLYTGEDGVQKLVGPRMGLELTTENMRKEIKQAFRAHRLASPAIPSDRIFKWSRAMYLGKSSYGVTNNAGPAGVVIATFTFAGLGKMVPAILLNGGVAITGAAGVAWMLPFLALPLIVDLGLLPFQLRKTRKEFGYLFGELGRHSTVKDLQDRTMESWQLKPHMISHRDFSRILDAIQQAE